MTADRLAWAVEEELHRGTDGRDYLVPVADDDVWWISVGWRSVVGELAYSIDPRSADGLAVLNPTRRNTLVGSNDLVDRVGSATGCPGHDMGDDRMLVAAVSIERLGELMTEVFTSVRPGMPLVEDPEWLLHRHPLRDRLADRP
jgi:hypothetical protein